MAARAQPEVTVVIPTRDRARRLLTALGCALAQEEVDVEVMVVDDGSVDDTAAAVAKVGHPGVRLLRNEVSHGVASACNRGAAEAAGEWVAFLDDDDLWAPCKLRRQLDAAAQASADWVYCGAVVLDERGAVLSHKPVPPTDGIARLLLTYNALPGGGSSLAVRRSVLNEVGGLDDQAFATQDWDLAIRLALHARAAACPEPLVAYVEHPGGRHLEGPARLLGDLEYLERKHGDAASRLGVALDRGMYWRYIASGQRRAGKRFSAARSYLRGAMAGRAAGNLMRAGGALLGDRAMRVGRRLTRQPSAPAPEWLSAVRRP